MRIRVTDHVGAVERDSGGLFRDATLYIGEVENRYLTKEVRRKVYGGWYKLPYVEIDNRKVLLKDGQKLAEGHGLTVQPVSLQELFLALCGEGDML